MLISKSPQGRDVPGPPPEGVEPSGKATFARDRLATLLAAWAAALLTGCATPPPDIAGPLTAGRLALRVDATPARPAQNLSVAFELRGDAERGEMRLLTPIGTQVAAARWAPGEASLTDGDGTHRFANLDELADAAFGEPLPLGAWPDWLAGRPWAGAPHRVINGGDGGAGGFEQLGWRVDTTRLADGLLVASRATPPAVSLRVRLDNPAP